MNSDTCSQLIPEKADTVALPQDDEPLRNDNEQKITQLPRCQILGGWMLFFNTWGILTSFGVFQTHYESHQLFHASPSKISWIGSIQACLIQFGGLFSGPLYDRGYFRELIITGGLFIISGHMLLSIATQWWHAFLSQGLCIGLGMGCLFVPCISLLPPYFPQRLGLAIGVASSGASIGGVVYPIAMHRLLNIVGFAWSVRVLGFITLFTMAVPIAVMRMRFVPAKPRRVLDGSALTDYPYLWFSMAATVGFLGFSAFQIYFSFFAANRHITSLDLAFDLVPIYNGFSTFGRILPNAISDSVGPFNILAPSTCLTGILYFCTPFVRDAPAMIAITAIAGFLSGIFTALPPVCFAVLIADHTKLGTRMGMGYAAISLGMLTGGPIAGAILGGIEPLNWTAVWYFAGSTMMVSSLMYGAIRMHRSGFRYLVKV